MKSLLLTVLPVVSANVVPRQSFFGFGNFFSTGPVATNSWIRQATTTMAVDDKDSSSRALPSPLLVLGELTLSSECARSKTHTNRSPCNFAAGDNNWCSVASTFDGMVSLSLRR